MLKETQFFVFNTVRSMHFNLLQHIMLVHIIILNKNHATVSFNVTLLL